MRVREIVLTCNRLIIFQRLGWRAPHRYHGGVVWIYNGGMKVRHAPYKAGMKRASYTVQAAP